MKSVSGRWPLDARPGAVALQAQRLWGSIDRRVVWLLLALIGVDLFFLGVHAVHSIYTSLYTDRVPVLGWRWDIMYDRSYLEIFGYLKYLLIIGLLIALPAKKDRPSYLAFAAIFLFALLDDSLMLHETLGQLMADALALQPIAGLRATDFGELLFWAGAGALLSGLAVIAMAGSSGRDRPNCLLLLGAVAALMVFAVGVDMVHVLLEHAFRGSGLLFTVIEEGGQQIALSLSCCLALLIRRDAREREAARAMRG